MLDSELLDILACPVCGARLLADGDRLVCSSTRVSYPVEGGIPILLSDKAEPSHPEVAPQTAEQSD